MYLSDSGGTQQDTCFKQVYVSEGRQLTTLNISDFIACLLTVLGINGPREVVSRTSVLVVSR